MRQHFMIIRIVVKSVQVTQYKMQIIYENHKVDVKQKMAFINFSSTFMF